MVINWRILLVDTLTIGTVIIYPTKETLAQNITTDGTLGTPQTLTGPNYDIPQSLGQTVNSNLFHSFGKFNLNSNEAAIFQSGNEINNIFSRVTGGSPSSINGLIRTLGQDVNLFFLNPSGIIFGPNASLDVSGSFLATTADSFVFGDGLEFSATNPQEAPLLTVNFTPGLQYGENHSSRTIENQGNLAAGQNLELLAGNLDLQGQLQAGQDLTLQADSIEIRDSLTNPFIAAAGDRLLIQGNESVDIFALNNPSSGLFSGGDMTLSSANPVVGDIHFWSGGNFEIKGLDDSKGDLFSFYDPIIRASRDVSFDSYEGVSLHIFAGGSVNISGDINITSADTVENSIQERVTLSDGETVVDINGNTEPTLDIRAGTIAFRQLGIIGSTDGLSNFRDTEGVATSADINIQNITNDGGLVFLTNQNQPDSDLSGEITVGSIDTSSDLGGGNVFVDSRDGITVNSLMNVSGTSANPIDPNATFSGDGGDVTLFANGNISFNPGSSIISYGLLGGDINLKSDADISGIGTIIKSTSFTNVPRTIGGDISLVARSLSLTEGAEVSTITFGEGATGDLNVIATESVQLIGTNANGRSGSGLFAQTAGAGDSGDLTITTKQLLLQGGAQIGVSTFDEGDAGSLTIIASESVQVLETRDTGPFPSGLFALTIGKGAGGKLTISTEQLLLQDGAQISAGSAGEGNGGSLTVKASESVKVIGTSGDGQFPTSIGVQSDFVSDPSEITGGDAGELTIETQYLLIADGAIVSAATLSDGDAGRLNIIATEVELTGTSADGFFPSRLLTGVAPGVMGKGGNLVIKTERLFVINGAEVSAVTLGNGDAGAISITATDAITLSGKSSRGFPSAISSQVRPGAKGDSKGISITTSSLSLTGGAVVSARTEGEGTAGNIAITAKTLEATSGSQIQTNTTTNFDAADITLKINDNLFLSGTESGLFAQTEGAGDAGDIIINASNLSIDKGASISAFTEASGDGGTITVNAPQSVFLTDNSKLTVETSGAGKPGDITITTPNLTIGKDAEISATATQESTNTEGGGSITVNASNLDLTGKLGIFAETQGKAPAGTLNIQPDHNQPNLDIQFTDTAIISASTTASGTGGDINLTAPESINITGQGKVAVETRGTGDAGNININTQNFKIGKQTEISASTFSSGKAGDINITANNFNLEEGARVITNTTSSGQAGDIQLQIRDNLNLVNSTIGASTAKNSSGQGGNINIDPQTVLVKDGATIAVNSDGSGKGGSITLIAEELTLDKGSITAETASNQGGNITLDIGNTLSFKNSGQITASAGTEQAGGDGGNIKINADFILAFPTDKTYEITANAFEGNGGNIQLTTNSFFGSEFVKLSASSQFGLEGDVSVDVLEIDPARGLTELPTNIVDASQQIAQGCTPKDRKESSRFIATGRGGLPLSPNEPLRGKAVITNWVNEPTEIIARVNNQSPTKLGNESSAEIVEAQAWRINERGNLELVAESPAQFSPPISVACNK